MKLVFGLIFSLCCFFISNKVLHAQIYNYQILNHKSGLSTTTAKGIYAKNDGGILIGTLGSGIVAYDGYRFSEVKTTAPNHNQHVTDIEIIQGEIYYASKYQGVYSVEKGKIVSIDSDGIFKGHFSDIAHAKDYLISVTAQNIFATHLKNKQTKQLFENSKKGLSVSTCIELPGAVIILSNQGNFIFNANHQFEKLSDYFNSTAVNQAVFAYYTNNQIYLFDATIEQQITIDVNTKEIQVQAIKNHYEKLQFNAIASTTFNKVKQVFACITTDGFIFELGNQQINLIHKNIVENIKIKSIVADINGDYWATTSASGLLKMSKQPFTKIEFHKEFLDHLISFIYVDEQKDNIVISNFNNSTYIGSLTSGKLKHLNLAFNGQTKIGTKIIFASDNGLYQYHPENNHISKLDVLNGEEISFIKYHNSYLWVGVYGKGLLKFNADLKLVNDYSNIKHDPDIIYTGQFYKNKLFIGTNRGVYRFLIEQEKFVKTSPKELGYYSGLSTVDAFGTLWFTIDKGLFGISNSGQYFKLNDPKDFPSFLFYTLNSDQYGNIILGTNKGLNVLQVNENGQILNQNIYQSGEGFEGYETNTRASFQTDKFAYVGTIEGLYKLNINYLKKLPPPSKPVVKLLTDKDIKEGLVRYHLLSKNPKIKTVYYTFKIEGVSDWSKLTTSNTIDLIDLPRGKHTLIVKSTYNGITFSDLSTSTINIDDSLLHGNILIYILIGIILLINVLFYLNSKNRDKTFDALEANEIFTTGKFAPSIILLGLLCHVVLRIILPLISRKFDIDLIVSLPITILLSYYYIRANHFKKLNNDRKMLNQLSFAFTVFMIYGIYNFFYHDTKILYAFFIVLVNSVAHLMFEKLKHAILYTTIFFITVTLAIHYSNSIYIDKYVLMIPMVISSVLVVFLNFVNRQSYQQQTFVSSVINKSNSIALALNEKGKIYYASKNISNIIPVELKDIVNKPVSTLNQFIVTESVRKIDLSKDFEDGKIILVPFKNENTQITWIELSCKELAKGIQVLIGHDVTEKLNLQDTYQILVENAEDLIYKIDTKGHIQFSNSRFEDYTPKSSKSLNNKNFTNIIPKEFHKTVIDFLKYQSQIEERIGYIEFPIINKNQELEWFGHNFSKLYTAGDMPVINGYLVVSRNITEKLKHDQLISLQQANITSSINYAKSIQINLLPTQRLLNECFKENFVIYKPKDIVSGDFYWCTKLEDHIIFAVGDGTGHGVPGAFMSILGINLLNSIIVEKRLIDPGLILNEMDVRLRNMLSHKGKKKLNDGIEITICVYEPKTKTFQYACAGSKLIIHDGVKFSRRRGDRKHIGDIQENFDGYITNYLNINKETTIYLFSDGYIDQFGGIHEKKFSIRRMLDLFINNINLPFSKQEEVLKEELQKWKSKHEQTDDITILGIRI